MICWFNWTAITEISLLAAQEDQSWLHHTIPTMKNSNVSAKKQVLLDFYQITHFVSVNAAHWDR